MIKEKYEEKTEIKIKGVLLMNYIIRGVLYLYFLLSLSGCSNTVENPTNQESNKTAVNNWSSSLDQIKKDTLDKACDDQMRSYYEAEIKRQSKHLNPAQIEKSLKNMQEDMVCK